MLTECCLLKEWGRRQSLFLRRHIFIHIFIQFETKMKAKLLCFDNQYWRKAPKRAQRQCFRHTAVLAPKNPLKITTELNHNIIFKCIHAVEAAHAKFSSIQAAYNSAILQVGKPRLTEEWSCSCTNHGMRLKRKERRRSQFDTNRSSDIVAIGSSEVSLFTELTISISSTRISFGTSSRL